MNYSSSQTSNQSNKLTEHVLNYQLNLIDKQQKSELRMQNNVKQRFRKRYFTQMPSVTKKGSDIRMFETHHPGFCYNSNGTVKSNYTVPLQNDDSDIQKVVDMLFTNGELDTNKILCLHLLGTHRCESLRPPGKAYNTLSFLAREQSPLERLIERSRKRNSQKNNEESKFTKLLPTYVLNLGKGSSSKQYRLNPKQECLIRDGRLATRLIINENISNLIQAVLEALQRSNPSKMSELLMTAKNPQKLKEIVNSQDLQQFINSLTGHSLLSSCENFHLSQPFKPSVSLDVNSPSYDLEKLVTEIRHNVLRIPKNTTKKKPDESRKLKSNNPNNPLTSRSSTRSTPTTANSTPGTPQTEPLKTPLKTSLMDPEVNKSYFAYVKRLSKKGLFDIEKLAELLNNKIREANNRDIKEHKKKLAAEERKRLAAQVDSDSDDSRALSRKSYCAACSEKWKQPLPQPKTYTRKNKVTGVDPSLLKCFLSKSTYMITMMIKDEADKMEQRKIKRRTEELQKRNDMMKQHTKSLSKTYTSENTRRSSYLLRKAKVYAQYHGYKPMEYPGLVNNLNLAKIKNQILIKENVKKIKKFLDEPLLPET